MTEIIFSVHEAGEGGYYAKSVGPAIFAEDDTLDELKANIKGGVDCYYEKPNEVAAHFGITKDKVVRILFS